MIKNIEGKKIEIILQPAKIALPLNIQQKINNYWQEAIIENPNLWNGEIICVTNYYETKETLTMVCQKSDYAHYLYDERKGLPKEYKCCNVSAGALLETLDGYYVIGELSNQTSQPKYLSIPAGNIEDKDIKNRTIDIIETIQREVLEEVNINIKEAKQVLKSKLSYLMPPVDNSPGYEFCGVAILSLTAKQMKEQFDKYLKYLRENSLEIEFEKIHFIKKENALEELEKLPNPKREYLKSLIQEDSKIAQNYLL